MKRLSFLASLALTAVLTFSTTLCSAQDSIQYQLVIRNSAGQLVTGKQVNMRFSLMSGEQTFYQETMPANTNQFGNINVMIGTGKALKGSMKDVPWSTMDISLKVEADTEGGEKFAELGTVPIAASPYAMYAATAGGNASNGSPKGDEALFEVCDRDGQPVFAVYNDGIVVYIDQNSADKAKRSGLVVTGRKATKEGETADYFSVTTEGTHIYVDEDDSNKAKRSGLIVHGRKATKDGDNTLNSYLTVDASGTHVFVDSAGDDKAKRSGLVVTGRKATKDGEPNKFLTIDANATQFYIDENDSDKAKRSGFVVTGRKATKDDDLADNAYFAVTADGTNVIVDNDDDKAKRSVLVITGRKATKAGSEVFAVDGDLTHVYIDDDDAKAKRSGLVVTGRKATKDGTDYIDIDANRANLVSQSINISAPGDDAMAMQVSNDELFINNMAIDGELRRWLTLPSVDEPYKLEVTTDQTIENSELVDDIMGDYNSFVVMAELDEEKRCMPYINEQQTMAFDQNGELTYDIENAYVVVDYDYDDDLNIHPIKPCDNLIITFAMVNYDGYWAWNPQNGSTAMLTNPINYREFNITIKAETIEPSIEVVAATRQQYDDNGDQTYFGLATVNGKEYETDELMNTSTDMVTYGSEVTLEATANAGYVFVGWLAYSNRDDLYEGYGEIARYSENPLKIRATRNVYYLAQFKSLEEPLYVNHNNDHSEWCYGDDDSHNGTNGCDDALYSVEKALQILAGYNSPNANFTIDVTYYNEDFSIGSELNGKAATLTIKNSIFAYNTTGKVSINTTVPVGIESSYYGSTEDINASFAVGAGASLALKNVKVNRVELNATAQLFMVGAEVTEPVQLAEGQTITLYNIGNKATITPSKYEDGLPILTVPELFGESGAYLLASDCENFAITPKGDEENGMCWAIDQDGKLIYTEKIILFELTSNDLTMSNVQTTIARLSDDENTRYKFVITDEGVNANNLSYLYQLLNPNKNGNKTFGPSKLDMSKAAGYSNSVFSYNGDNYSYKVASNNYFFNNLTSITLPSKAEIDQNTQTNWFKYVQETLEEINIDNTTNNSDMWMADGAIMCRQWDSWNQEYKYSLYCYPAQRKGSSYTIPEDIPALFDAAFYKNENLTEIENLNKVTRVGGSVFEETQKLEEIDLSGVTEFEVKGSSGGGSESPFLFRNSNVKKVTLPDWQYTIGEGWFDGCSKLEEVVFSGTTPPRLTCRYSIVTQYTVSNHFSSINNNVIFRVPSGAVINYIEPTGTGMDNGYAYYEFANTTGNSLFANNTYYITDGTDIAVGVNRIAEAISNVNANGQTIIIGGSLADAQWQSLNTALANASFSITLDFSKQTIASFGTWLQNNTNLAGIVLPDNVTTIDAGAFSGCTNLNNINLDANDWYVTDNDGNPTSKVVLNNGQTFANYLQSCNSKLVKVQSTFYVQQGGNGNGSISNPLGSIQDAVDIILAKTNSNIDYTINVKGTLSGAQTMNGTTLAENCSITLQGVIDNGSQQQPTLNGGFSDNNNGTTLTITTTMPVTIKNLKITGGYNSFGGGLAVTQNYDNDVVVTLDDGAIIAENTAIFAGGGVFINADSDDELPIVKVNLKNGGTITGNTLTKDASANTDGAHGGAGVCVCGSSHAQFVMNGGSVSRNSAQLCGGGVSVCFYAKFTMYNGIIGGDNADNGNKVSGSGDGYSSYGGGVYLRYGTFTMDGSGASIKYNTCIGQGNEDSMEQMGGAAVGIVSNGKFVMKDGTISNNIASNCSGGGVFVRYASSNFTMTGGTIKDNSCTKNGNGVNVYLGTFTMDEDASVHNSNDVYLRTEIIIGESYTNNKGATITPSSYDEGESVITGIDDSNLSDNICSRFKVTPQADGTEWEVVLNNTNRNIGELKKSPTYGYHNTPELLPSNTTGSNGTNSRYLLFGDYPSTHKPEGVTVNESKGKAMGGFTYYPGSDGNWYVKHPTRSYSEYSDGSSSSEGDDWFRVTPIKWRLLTTKVVSGKTYAMLLADSIISGLYLGKDNGSNKYIYYSLDYNHNNGYYRTINGATVYPNNYQYSNMRAWLNGYSKTQLGTTADDAGVDNWQNIGFLQKAFTTQAQNLIPAFEVDNSREQCFAPDETSSTFNEDYLCENTFDKVFLISMLEATSASNGFEAATTTRGSRRLIPTDFARGTYALVGSAPVNIGGIWYFRTPTIYHNGNPSNLDVRVAGNDGFAGNTNNTHNEPIGVVPAIWVELDSETATELSTTNPTGSINGKFSVGDDKQVYFSQGNLQYQASSGTWRFAEHQYDYVGNDAIGNVYENGVKSNNANVSDTYTGWIDLFCWGTGDNPTKYDQVSDYSNFTEWGSNMDGSWRTLTNAEWVYLIGREGKCACAQITIDGSTFNGLVLLPDNWSGQTLTPSTNNFPANQFNQNTWAEMQQNGAVFLPAAGGRGYDKSVQNLTTTGNYWSSETYDGTTNAYYFYFSEVYGTNTNQYNLFYCGYSVRLVKEANP